MNTVYSMYVSAIKVDSAHAPLNLHTLIQLGSLSSYLKAASPICSLRSSCKFLLKLRMIIDGSSTTHVAIVVECYIKTWDTHRTPMMEACEQSSNVAVK